MREIKDAYLEGGNSIYVKTHSNAVYVDDNETETLTQRLNNVKNSINEHTSQLDNVKKSITEHTTQLDNVKNSITEHTTQLETKANEADLIVERNRIDLLTKIENGETAGNTELLDIRNGSDGIQYASAGESVRNQIKNIKSLLNSIEKGYFENSTAIEGQTINAWIWKNSSGDYWAEDNATSITKKFQLEKGKKYRISGYTEHTGVIYGFSDKDYTSNLFMNFPSKIDGGGQFSFEFTAERNYVYVYYGKTTDSNDTINCINKETHNLEFINVINDDIYKYCTNEYSTSFKTSTANTQTVFNNIMLAQGHEYEITLSSDAELNQTKLEIGCGSFTKTFETDNFDLSKSIKFSFISSETTKEARLWIYLKNHLTNINVNVSLKDITGMKKVNNNIALSFENGGFNGGAYDYDSTTMIRTNRIYTKKECMYLITYPTDIYCTYNVINSSNKYENRDTYGSFSVKGKDSFLRLSFTKIDGSELNISNCDTSQIKVLEVYSNNKNYDITVSAPNTDIQLKEKSDLILEGTDLTYDTRLIQSIIASEGSIDVLFYPGEYKLNEIHKTKYGQYGILTTNEYIKNTQKMINVYGYQKSVFSEPSVDFQVTGNLHNSLNSSNENAIFLVPKPDNGNVTSTSVTIKGLRIENYDIDKAIVAVDLSCAGATTIEDTMVKVQQYPGYKKFTQEPNRGLVGIRVGYGSNYGIRNSVKHVSVRHHYIGHSCCGEHFIYEDAKAHDCMIGFAFGDKNTQPKMEHPNMMIGCSIEQCARLMLLNRYGETVESSVDNGAVTLVCTGLSCEPYFKGIGDGEGYDTLPIKEVIKGLYRGKIEGDYRGKSVSFFENDGSGKNMTQLVY